MSKQQDEEDFNLTAAMERALQYFETSKLRDLEALDIDADIELGTMGWSKKVSGVVED